jgi:CheY-like chemotaxis protein
MPIPLQILIVEDHEYLRSFLVHLVAKTYLGANIVVSANGAEALDVYHQHQPDLIISDYQMPIINGLGLVRTLRGQGATVPILILSSDPSIADAILSAGANQFLFKPFPIWEFTQILRTLLPIAPA